MGNYRRLFIVRKDLNMSKGKMSAQLAHCAEVYWLHQIKEELFIPKDNNGLCYSDLILDKNIVDNYLLGSITKTICQAKNKNQLMKAKELALSAGLKEGKDFGFIRDLCRTELTPENADGTTITAFWTAPIPDEIAHKISKKFNLYTDEQKKYKWIEIKNKITCGKCGKEVSEITHFCPHCGAEMEIKE